MPRHLITGSEFRDYLDTQESTNDLVYAYGGDDIIDTGYGDDLIYAGAGADHVITGLGHDKVFGGDDGDSLFSDFGDTLYGDAGADVLRGTFGSNVLYGGRDDDVLFSGGVTSYVKNDLFGGTGNDQLTFLLGSFGTADGGDGVDVVSVTLRTDFSRPLDAAVVTLTAGSGTISHGGRLLTLTGIESLNLQAGFGDDTVQTGAGNDGLSVSFGANVVDAGAGDDRVAWNTGATNVLEGGLGNDTLILIHSSAPSGLVFSAAGGVVSDGYGSSLTGFEQFVIFGSVLGDQATLGSGSDQFFGSGGTDAVSGGDGRDWLMGQLGDDTLLGEGAADALNGGFGQDVLDGGTGRDTLTGALGSDTLTGGAGADLFRFLKPESDFDVITDFTPGADRLVFSRAAFGMAADASPLDAGFLALDAPNATHGQFVFGGLNAGELRWDADGTGAGAGDTIAILQGVTSLTAADFLLLP